MKIEFDDSTPGENRINAYGGGSFTVANTTFTSSLVITPEKIVTDWLPSEAAELTAAHVEMIISLTPEIVLFGTGATLKFPANDVVVPLLSRQIGYEVMDTGAACRCYNFLLSERRRVAAILFRIDVAGAKD